MTKLIDFTTDKAEEFQLATFIHEDKLEEILFEDGWEALRAKIMAKYTPKVVVAITYSLECLNGVSDDIRALMVEFAESQEAEIDFYSPDCPACLRHLPHSLEEHEAALRRNYEASLPDYPDGYMDW